MSFLSSSPRVRGLFDGYGVELEYMIVDANLDVLPVADRLLSDARGEPIETTDGDGEVERGAARWSNELVRHVVELKTNGPADSLAGLAAMFQHQVRDALQWLAEYQACLLPTGMHPWMDPDREMQLWPHDYHEVYEAFHRVFNCRGHGWANLQSVHLNLPFADEAEFGRLHAAVRLLLPLLPALSASSPFRDGRRQVELDHRLYVYMNNARPVPAVTGAIIPEPVATFDEYQRHILQPMYRAIAPLDPEGILQHEWLNARGAIARFSRRTIEIRLLDVQECPSADLAVCAAIVAILRGLVAERWSSWQRQLTFPTARLSQLLTRCVVTAEQTPVDDFEYRALLGLPNDTIRTAGDVWKALLDREGEEGIPVELRRPLEVILTRGPVARRMLAWGGSAQGSTALRPLYQQLATCLAQGELLDPQ